MTTEPHALAVDAAAWQEVCRLEALPRERGAAALVGGVQVALFRTFDDTVHAVQQWDPYCGANVMARGIVGSRGDRPPGDLEGQERAHGWPGTGSRPTSTTPARTRTGWVRSATGSLPWGSRQAPVARSKTCLYMGEATVGRSPRLPTMPRAITLAPQ